VKRGETIKFIRDAIQEHRNSDAYKIAVDADEYDAQRNVTINETVKRLYSISSGIDEKTGAEKMSVGQHTDSTASNHHIASNFFHRLNTDRAAYSLGNGVTFDEEGVKDKLGPKFDTDLFNAGKLALMHGVTFCFWNLDRLHVFPLTEFVPLWDESDGSLKAGIRYWSIDWKRKPVYAVLYEIDGYTKFKSKGKSDLTLEEMEPKRAYRQTVAHTDAGGDEVIGEDNYSALPIVPLYGNEQHQSTLVGMRGAIDAYDLISSGYCNEVSDTAQIYWLIGNALGMTDDDVQHFMDRLRFTHAAAVDTENSTVTPYTQEPPYNAREAVLTRLARGIYRDFGAFNPEDVAAGAVTATQINAAYQPMDEEADAFEYQIIEFVQQILKLQGLEGTPQFKRNRIANQTEQIANLVQMGEYLDEQTMLELNPLITPDMVDEILARKAEEAAGRLQDTTEIEAIVRDILAQQNTPE